MRCKGGVSETDGCQNICLLQTLRAPFRSCTVKRPCRKAWTGPHAAKVHKRRISCNSQGHRPDFMSYLNFSSSSSMQIGQAEPEPTVGIHHRRVHLEQNPPLKLQLFGVGSGA